MSISYSDDIAAVQRVAGIDDILEQVCRLTGMGFAAVARVTEDRWVACQLVDKIECGLKPGDELQIKTTICDEIRASGKGVYIDDVDGNPKWRLHHTPVMYGFKSYISIPIMRADGSFFGTLCAIDPRRREGEILARLVPLLEDFAAQIAAALDSEMAD